MYYYYYYNYTLKRSKLDWIQSEALDRYTRKNRICHRTAITYVFFLLLSSPPLLNASWIFLFSFLDQHYFVQQLLRQTELVDWLADWLTDLLVVHTTTTSLSLSPRSVLATTPLPPTDRTHETAPLSPLSSCRHCRRRRHSTFRFPAVLCMYLCAPLPLPNASGKALALQGRHGEAIANGKLLLLSSLILVHTIRLSECIEV